MKIVKVLLTIACIFLAACTVRVDDSMIVSPEKEINQSNLATLMTTYGYKEKHITGTSGELYTLYKQSKTKSSVTLLVLHGNALNLSLQPWFGVLKSTSELNVNILAIDYSGYGYSKGKASFSSMKEDAKTALQSIDEKQQIYLYGLSLGSVMATELVNEPNVTGLIIEGGITTTAEMIEIYKSRNTFGSLVSIELDEKIRFNNPKLIKKTNKPLLVIHGQLDENIPSSMGESLFESSSNPKSEMYQVKLGNHCDTFKVEPERYLSTLNEFIGTTKNQL